jgi:hypothetical protein
MKSQDLFNFAVHSGYIIMVKLFSHHDLSVNFRVTV